jgi:hypothetical protein
MGYLQMPKFRYEEFACSHFPLWGKTNLNKPYGITARRLSTYRPTRKAQDDLKVLNVEKTMSELHVSEQ